MLASALFIAAFFASVPAGVCSGVEKRALDFWIGQWKVVHTASNMPIARSDVSRVVNGCAIEERYEQSVGPGGRPMNYSGRSYSAFNDADRKWHQFYVDTAGAAFSYLGEPSNNGLVLVATAGARATKMTLRPQKDGSVRQIGLVSADGGKTWAPNFDFTYRRRSAPKLAVGAEAPNGSCASLVPIRTGMVSRWARWPLARWASLISGAPSFERRSRGLPGPRPSAHRAARLYPLSADIFIESLRP